MVEPDVMKGPASALDHAATSTASTGRLSSSAPSNHTTTITSEGAALGGPIRTISTSSSSSNSSSSISSTNSNNNTSSSSSDGNNAAVITTTASITAAASPVVTSEGRLSRVKRLLTCQPHHRQQQQSSVPSSPKRSVAATAAATTTTTSASTASGGGGRGAPLTYDEARASVKAARKRKERQESLSSLSQERKVIRSNSEERPVGSGSRPKDDDIRRVSSHEDFQKNHHSAQSHNDSNGKRDAIIPIDIIECEYEKRRSHERFSRPLVQRNKYNGQGRRPKSKQFPKGGPSYTSNNANNNATTTTALHNKRNATKTNNATSAPIHQFEDGHNTSAFSHAMSHRIDDDDHQQMGSSHIHQHHHHHHHHNNHQQQKETCTFLQLYQEEREKERSPSPVHTPISPALDLTTLHQQIDCAEPLPSTSVRSVHDDDDDTIPSLSMASNRLLSSPRNSVIITQRIYLNPDVQQTSTDISKETAKNLLEQRMKQLTKQINSVKKKMRRCDEEFETRFGYRPSHADKLNDRSMKKLSAELGRLKREQKQLTEDAAVEAVDATSVSIMKMAGALAMTTASAGPSSSAGAAEQDLQNTLNEIEKKLSSKRASGERSEVLDDLSGEQLMEEKIAVQKALLYLESIHGRPTNKEDKDLARPLYDRYRSLKRMVTRFNMTNSIIELATIHEHETMDFTPAPTAAITTGTAGSGVADQSSAPSDSSSEKLQSSTTTDSSDTDTSIGENLHALTLDELRHQQRRTAEDKKQLRRSLKEFEHEFEERTGRKLQREDRQPMDNTYMQYKKAKAKLRLLDALVGKQAQ